jgi:hypothetical protein
VCPFCRQPLFFSCAVVESDRHCFFPFAINFLGTGFITAMVKEICGSTFDWLDGDAATGFTWYSGPRVPWGDAMK